MHTANLAVKNAILKAALPAAAFDGWTQNALENAAQHAGYDAAMVRAVFPAGVKDALTHLSQWADAAMIEKIGKAPDPQARIRDRIAEAVAARLEALGPYKEAERLAIAYWFRPLRKYEGAKLLWKTADTIWTWAGDTSTDYNHYTKRSLLCGVIGSTTLFWLNDTSKNCAETKAFLDRRIDNVLSFGKMAGKVKNFSFGIRKAGA